MRSLLCPIPGDYFLPEELSIQQRQQEDLSHGTPIGGAPAYISASGGGGTTKANPPKVLTVFPGRHESHYSVGDKHMCHINRLVYST